MRSPQHSDENGPSSMTFAHSLSTAAFRSGSMTGIVIPTCTSGDSGTDADCQYVVMAISTTSIAHVRLTVTDIERSRQFYEGVFGWPVLVELPPGADAATREALAFLYGGGVIYDLGGA